MDRLETLQRPGLRQSRFCALRRPWAVWFSVLAVAPLAFAGNWPQFRGPHGDGTTEDAAPIAWSGEKNLRWSVALPGPGSSSPIVFEDRVFVTCYSGYGAEGYGAGAIEDLKRHLICLDARTGAILWDAVEKAASPEDPYRGYITEHGYASNTPTTDGRSVFVFFGKSGAMAFDYDGRRLWKADLGRESSNRRWGSAASPILHGDLLIVNASDESQSLRGLNKKTGEEVWKAEAASLELAYGTPRVMPNADGVDELVISVPQEVWGLHLDTGKLAWWVETGLPGNICPTLVYDDDGIIYTSGGFPSTGAAALRGGGEGAGRVIWKSRAASYVPSFLLRGDHLYWVSDRGVAHCVRKDDGEAVYQESLDGVGDRGRSRAFYASAAMAGGHIYAVSRRAGVFVLAARPQFELVAHNVLPGDETDFNASPAFSDGAMFLRSNRRLYCVSAR